MSFQVKARKLTEKMNEWNWGWLCVLTQATRNLRIVWVISMENIQMANSRFLDKFISYYRQPISRAMMSICDARFEAAVTQKTKQVFQPVDDQIQWLLK